jgi:hypothetical protein
VTDVKLGINLWSQASDWPSFLAAGTRAEELGYDSLWTWDHIYAIFGDPYQPIVEGYTALAALAQATSRSGWGCSSGRTRSGTRASREVADDDRPHQRRPGDPRHRRGVVRAGAHRLRDRLRVGASGSGSTGSTSRCGAIRTLLGRRTS